MEFDFEFFKNYVNTYEPKKDGLNNDNIIIKDMIYGIGISLDNKYKYQKGYNKFILYIKDLHASVREKKLKRILK